MDILRPYLLSTVLRGRNKRGDWQIFAKNNKRRGCNQRGSWQKSLKLKNGEVEINGEAGKNTAIRNFIEIKSSKNLVEISTKRNTNVVYLHEESLVLLLDSPLHATSCFIVINFLRCERNNMYNKQFCGFDLASRYRCRLCTWINKRGVWNKKGGRQNFPKLLNGECWIRLGKLTKNGIINKRGVQSIWNSRVIWHSIVSLTSNQKTISFN